MNQRPTPDYKKLLVGSERARASLNEALDKTLAENRLMREAIREAHRWLEYYKHMAPTLCEIPERAWSSSTEGKSVVSALTKLQPFIDQ